MNEKMKLKILQAYNNDKLRTDSDVEDFAEENNVGFDDVLRVVANCIAAERKSSCEGCKHVIEKYFYGAGEPCCRCSRYIILADHYEKI